jgi:hypothetical protein
MRTAYLLVLLPALAQSSEVEFDFITSVLLNNPDLPVTWNGRGPAPTTFEYTFFVDSLSANSVSYAFGNSSSLNGPCLISLNYQGLAATNINAYANGVAVFHANSGTFGIEGPNASGGCPGRFFAGELLQTGSSRFFADMDFGPGITKAAFVGSADPLGTLLNGARYDGPFSYSGSLGSFTANGLGTSVQVPEPDSLALLAAGALGLLIFRKLRAAKVG